MIWWCCCTVALLYHSRLITPWWRLCWYFLPRSGPASVPDCNVLWYQNMWRYTVLSCCWSRFWLIMKVNNMIIFLVCLTSRPPPWSQEVSPRESPGRILRGGQRRLPPPPWWRPGLAASRPSAGPAGGRGCRLSWPPGSRSPRPGSWSLWGTSRKWRRRRCWSHR